MRTERATTAAPGVRVKRPAIHHGGTTVPTCIRFCICGGSASMALARRLRCATLPDLKLKALSIEDSTSIPVSSSRNQRESGHDLFASGCVPAFYKTESSGDVPEPATGQRNITDPKPEKSGLGRKREGRRWSWWDGADPGKIRIAASGTGTSFAFHEFRYPIDGPEVRGRYFRVIYRHAELLFDESKES